MVLTAANTGLRLGEMVGLKRHRVNVSNVSKGYIDVVEALSEVRGGLVTARPKTDESIRRMELPAFLARALKDHFSQTVGEYVFQSPHGGPIRAASFRRRYWVPAVEASVGRPCRIHDLRHTHVAWLIASGVDPKSIARRLGHTSVSVVLDVYGHLFEGHDRAVATKLDELHSRGSVHFLFTPPTADVVPMRAV